MVRKTADLVDRYVGMRLKRRRLEMGYTQEELAKVVHLTCQQVQKYENGINQIPTVNLYEFAKLLKVKISYFFDNYEIFMKGMKYFDYINNKNQFKLICDVSCIVDYYVCISSEPIRKMLQKVISTSIKF